MSAKRYIVGILTLSTAGLMATATREGGFVRTAYLDPAQIPTICVGHTAGVKIGQTADLSTCERLLQEDTGIAQAAVRRLVKVPLSQGQYDELVDFTFNAGSGNLASSTLLKKINAGDCKGAGEEFLKWNKAKGIELRGLTNRRILNRKGWDADCT